MPRVISVPKKFAGELKGVLQQLSSGVLIAAGGDFYKHIKNHLSANNIPHSEHSSTSTVPNDHTYWEHK